MGYIKLKLPGLLFGMLSFVTMSCFGQVRSNLNLINNGAANSTAFLDASSTASWNNSASFGKGIIFPRADLTLMASVQAPGVLNLTNYPTLLDGMLVYNTGTGVSLIGGVSVSPGFYYYRNFGTNLQGGIWIPMNTISGGGKNDTDWLLKGQSGLSKTSYIGTADLQPLIFKINGIESARIRINADQPGSLDLSNDLFLDGSRILSFGGEPENQNTFLGKIGLGNLTTGTANTLAGASAGMNIKSGMFNSFLGTLAGSEIQHGSENTFLGDNAGTYSVNGSFNTSVGRYAGPVGDIKYATAIGNGALVKQNNSLVLGKTGTDRPLVGINIEDPKGTLHIATDDAIVLPVGKTDTQPIGIPGMLRFNSERNFAEYFNNYESWVNISNNTGWTLQGNYGTVPAHHYVGTKDNQPVSFRAFGQEAFRINPVSAISANVNIKAPLWVNNQRMLWQHDPGKGPNLMVGHWDAFNPVYSITGSNNILFGYSSGGQITTGDNNVFIGATSGASNQTGNHNIGIGVQAGPDYPNISNSMVFQGNNRPRKSNVLLFGDEISGHGFSAVGINTSQPDAIFDVNSTGAMIVPVGTITQRPTSDEPGTMRFNKTTNLLEYYSGGWISLNPPKIFKTVSTLKNVEMNLNTYQTYDIPVPGAKVGGVVWEEVLEQGWGKGRNQYCVTTDKHVISDGVVRLKFWYMPVPGLTGKGDLFVNEDVTGFIPEFQIRVTVVN